MADKFKKYCYMNLYNLPLNFYKKYKKDKFNYSPKEIFSLPNIFPFSLMNRLTI